MISIPLKTLFIFLVCQRSVAACGRRDLEEVTCANGGRDEYCHQFADCVDMESGSFVCTCQEGYTGDGRTCIDLDECQLTGDDYPCPSTESGGYCVNTFVHNEDSQTAALKGYKCGCDENKGFTNGPVSNVHGPTTCDPLNQCSDANLNDCDMNAVCLYSPANNSYTCECLSGYTGDGKTCEEDEEKLPTEEHESNAPSESPASFQQPRCPDTETEVLVSFDDFDDGSGVAHGWFNWDVDYSDQSSFTTFLGPFVNTPTNFPYKDFLIPAASQRVFVDFDFYEIDSWDGNGGNGPDTLGIQFKSTSQGVSTGANFGHFHYTFQETERSGSVGSLEWKVESTPIAQSPQGFDMDFQDQKHHITTELGSDSYSDQGDTLRVTIDWTLAGVEDESVGIDNVRVIACVDTVPSATPSLAPSASPTMQPTDERPRPIPVPIPVPVPIPATTACN